MTKEMRSKLSIVCLVSYDYNNIIISLFPYSYRYNCSSSSKRFDYYRASNNNNYYYYYWNHSLLLS